MITFRCKFIVSVALSVSASAWLSGELAAQTIRTPVLLGPISPSTRVDRTTVTNIYGSCGSAVVQVLGVKDSNDQFFTVDAAAGNSDVVVIAEGGQRQISLKRYLSDYNGVACVGKSAKKVLVWSDCGGSACGHGYQFTVVDVRSLRIVAGGPNECGEMCATRATGSDLPRRLSQ